MTEEWRNSEAQVISRGQWTKLNGTDTEVLIPKPGAISSAMGDGVVSPGNVVIRVRRAAAQRPGVTELDVEVPAVPGLYVFELGPDGTLRARKVDE